MSDEKLRNSKIPEIPADEKVITEGLMHTMRLEGKPHPFTFKFILTEKGIWTLTKKLPLMKQRTEFMPYDGIEFYEPTEYKGTECCVFHPKGRDAINRLFFEDHEGILDVFDRYLRRATDDDFIDDHEDEGPE
jgi:hypothetical protein